MNSNPPESPDAEELTHAAIWHIAWDVREGKANPVEANLLLEKFCNEFDSGMFNSGNLTQDYLLRHLRDAFRAYLNKGKTIESALGLVKKKGRPKADEQVRMQMAAEVLRHRMAGVSHQEALSNVSARFGWGETIIAEAWVAWQFEAIILLRIERTGDDFPWTSTEIQKLDEIFGGKPWYGIPEKKHPFDSAAEK
jgi:hypothetical protein